MSALTELGPQLAATILAQLNRLGAQAPLASASSDLSGQPPPLGVELSEWVSVWTETTCTNNGVLSLRCFGEADAPVQRASLRVAWSKTQEYELLA